MRPAPSGSAVRTFPVAAVIVGAGAGKRFGGPKAVAILPDGRRFLDAIVATARDAGLDPIVAVLPPGVAAGAGVRVVANPNADSEQISSVRIGLAQLTSEPVVAAIVWPVDYPFVQLDSALALLDGAKRTGARIVAPVHEGRRGHPVFFHRDVWRELMTVAEGGARTVVRSRGDRVVSVDVSDRGVVRDINTRDDLADASGAR